MKLSCLSIIFLLIPFASADLPSCPTYLRGDINHDERIDVSDAVFLLRWLFQGGSAPVCLEEANVNGDEKADLSDSIYLLKWLFQGGSAPVPDLEKMDSTPQLGFLLPFTSEDYLRAEGMFPELEVSPPHGVDLIEGNGEDDLLGCKIYAFPVNEEHQPLGEKKLIQDTAWENIPGFHGQALPQPFVILLKKDDFTSGRYGLEAECWDAGGQNGMAKMYVRVVPHEPEELDGIIPLADKNAHDRVLLQLPPPPINPSTPPLGCCTVTCSNGETTEETCQETTEDDCVSTSVKWGNKYQYTSPQHLCESVFGDGSNVHSVDWKGEKTCNTQVFPPTCFGDCKVDKMTVLFLPEHTLPPGLDLRNYYQRSYGPYQTYPEEGERNKLGHNEGYVVSTSSFKEESSGLFRSLVVYMNAGWEYGWSYFVLASLIPGSDPDACKEGQFANDHLSTELSPARILPDGSVAPQILDTKTNYILGSMYDQEKLLTRKRLKDIKLADVDEIMKYTWNGYETWRTPPGCFIGSSFVCGDDYTAPRDITKIHSQGSVPFVFWYDNPGARYSLQALEPGVSSLDIHIPVSVSTSDGGTKLEEAPLSLPTGGIKETSILYHAFQSIAIIEDSTGLHRYVCQLGYDGRKGIAWNNVPELATPRRKMQATAPECACKEQKWTGSQWENLKENLPCGWDGMKSGII